MYKRSRTFRITLTGDPDYIDAVDGALDRVVNTLNMNETEYLRTALADCIFNKQAEQAEAGMYEALDARVAKITQERHTKQKLFRKLDVIYKEDGPVAFMAWCENNASIPPEVVQEFMTQYTWRNEELGESKRAQEWLREFLADNKPHSTTEIHQAAERDGLIATESDWGHLRVIATRMGLSQTGLFGYWQLPQQVPLNA